MSRTATVQRATDAGAGGLPVFPIQEIGSLPKTIWRLKALQKQGVGPDEADAARREGERLGVADHEALVTLLEKGKGFTKQEKHEIKRWASRYTLRYLEDAGLDLVYDGEETRTEMYDWPVRHCTGFEDRGWLRSWDHLYFRKAAVVAPPRTQGHYHVEEFLHAQEHGRKALKVPVTGAYTLMDWSFDEHYFPKAQGPTRRVRRRSARRGMLVQLAREVLRPNIDALLTAGAQRIQVDEPAATTKPDEVDLFVESFNESVRGLDGIFSIHICFSDYGLLLPHILELRGCRQLALEFANKDSWETGTRREDRPGQEFLHQMRDAGCDMEVGLGVLDVHTDRVESPELVRDRILHAADVLGPEKVYVNPDCGLRTRRWPVVEAKLRSLVEGTFMARRALEGAE